MRQEKTSAEHPVAQPRVIPGGRWMITTKMMMLWKRVVTLAALMTVAAGAHAITLGGTDVNYTFDENNLGLYAGSYSVTGNTLGFTPTSFVNSGVIPLVSQTMVITVTPIAGQQFSSLSFLESGSYTEQNPNDVAVSGQLRILNPVTTSELTPSIPNPDFSSPGTNQAWQASINQDISSFYNASSLTITVQDLLINTGTLASINKNLLKLTIMTSPVPEVETWTMMLAGVGLIALQLRRRSGSNARAIK
jgi:hypothetical protein